VITHGVLVTSGVLVPVGVLVIMGVLVGLPGTGVLVGVLVIRGVFVPVGVFTGVKVFVGVAQLVRVGVGVAVGGQPVSTTTVPIMPGWRVQTYGNVPGVIIVWVNDWFWLRIPLSHPPVALVLVCGSTSRLVQRTVWPT
jgi:hypothetical protein